MTTELLYKGTWDKGKIKLADVPDYDSKTVELIYDPANGNRLTMSDSAAKVVMDLYPGVFENLTYPVNLPVEQVIVGTEEESSATFDDLPPFSEDEKVSIPKRNRRND